jgi:hypothetical protein
LDAVMSALTRLLNFADRRELPLVVVLVALLLVDGQWGPHGRGMSVAGVLAVLAIALPLLWRTAAPQVTLALVVIGVFACLATLKPAWSVVLVASVSVYTVALHGHRLRTLAVAACVVAITVFAMAVFSPNGVFSTEALARLVFLLLALVVGEAVRSRRAERRAADEREAERERRRGQ